jgi:hypothetical protein
MLIGTLTTLMLGINETSWAVQAAPAAQQDAARESVVRRLATMRRGLTVQIERQDRTKFYAVIEAIGPDSITVLRDEGKSTTTEVIPVGGIREIREVSPQKVAKGHKALIITAIVTGVIVGGLLAIVSSCRTATTTLATTPNPAGV